MKDEGTFSNDEPPLSASAHERGSGSDGHVLSSPSTVSQDAPLPAHPPIMERQLIVRHHVLWLLVAIVVVVLVVLAGGYGIFHAVTAPSAPASSAFQQAHCPFPLNSGIVEGQNVKCGFLTVPEDRSQPKGRTIQLAVAIFKTPNPHPALDPLLILSGGPGVPLLATTGQFMNTRNLTFYAPDRDVILLDQRGAGYSQPSLSCQINETLQACHDRLVREGINLSAYTTLENAADVHDLVRDLGYTQVNLEGTSYGTRLALTVMHLYPTDIRSVVLNSVVPTQENIFNNMATVNQHAFNALFQGCAANLHCNAAYPHLQTVFYRLVSNLNKKPINIPERLTGNTLVYWLFSALYYPALISQLLAVIFQTSHQDYTQLSLIYSNYLSVTSSLSSGLFYSVYCSEDMAYTTLQRLQASVQVLAPELRPAVLASLQEYYRACQSWKVKPVSAVQKEPVTSSIPTLIMEGEYDPITPPANGMLAAQTLSKSFFFLFPGVSHGVQTTNPCPHDLEYAFLDHPTEKPDASCISSMPEPDFS